MGLFYRTSRSRTDVGTELPPVSTIRRFHCLSCGSEVILCSCCDRGNVYCRSCGAERALARRRRAQAAYRSTVRGRKVRALAERRRRERRRSPPPDPPTPEPVEESVGDRGSLLAGLEGNSTSPGHVGPGDGDPVDDLKDPVSSPMEGTPLSPPAPRLVRCERCGRFFVPFQRQRTGRPRALARGRARAPPRKASDGGRTP
jgi:predicted RNA-binding Zn-ribbon protein involved in translation (DUF1610 family)